MLPYDFETDYRGSLYITDIGKHHIGHVFLPGEEVTYTSLVLQQETKDRQYSKILNLVRCFYQRDDTFMNISISLIFISLLTVGSKQSRGIVF